MSKLSAIQTLILSKIDAKSIRSIVTPGNYEEEFLVKASGMITVGEDFERIGSIPWKDIALTLMQKLPHEEVMQVIEGVAKGQGDMKFEEIEVRNRLASFLDYIPCKGKVTGFVQFTEEG